MPSEHNSADRDFAVPLTEQELQTAEEFRRQQQVAVLVVMFSDIEKSTQLLESKGELEYTKLRRRHDEVVRTVVERESAGRCVKHLGDGFMALFAEPSTAVERCLELHEKLARECDLKIRIGLDMGQISIEKAGGITLDAFGRFVNRAARINAAAAGGQTLASSHVWDSAIGWLPPKEFGWSSGGELQAKGFTHPVPVYHFFRPPGSSSVTPAYGTPNANKEAPSTMVEEEKKPYLERQISAVKSAIDSSNLEEAIKLCQQTMAVVELDSDVSSLLQFAEREYHLREQQREMEADQQVRASILLMSEKEFEKSAQVLEKVRTFDARVHRLLEASRAKQLPNPEELKEIEETLIGEANASPKKVLWLDDRPDKTILAQLKVLALGARLDVLFGTLPGLMKLFLKKHEFIVLVAQNANEGLRRLLFIKLIRQVGFKTPVLLFSNVRAAYSLAAEAQEFPGVQCTSSLAELTEFAFAAGKFPRSRGISAHLEGLIEARARLDEELRRLLRMVTVMFVSLVGSTQYFERFGEAAGQAWVNECMKMLALVAERNSGTVCKTIGDAMMSYFNDALAAVHAAVEMQRMLEAYNASQPESGEFHIRIGMNYGPGMIKDKDVFGHVVNVAARIQMLAPADSVYASASKEDERTTLENGLSKARIPYRKAPEAEEKGNAARVIAFEILWQEMRP